MARQIDIVSLYPKDMNIYGDSGNVLTVERRLALYGYEPRIHAINQNDPWPDHADIILGGGGQDNGQRKIIEDLFRRADLLRSLAQDAADGKLRPEDIDEKVVSDRLYTSGEPDPDLIIRPSGENRTSNFLLWQSAYAEYVIMDVLWPDFKESDFDAALIEYAKRNRRFGGV